MGPFHEEKAHPPDAQESLGGQRSFGENGDKHSERDDADEVDKDDQP